MTRRRSLPKILCLTSLLFSSSLLAQSAWTKAPPLPRACYSGQDTFHDQVDTVISELEAAIAKQDQMNRGIVDQVMKMEPATLQERMMAAMQKDPGRTQEIMEAMQRLATAQGEAVVAGAQEEASEFDTRKKTLMAEYAADRARVMSLYGNRPAEPQAANEHERLTPPAVLADNNTKYQSVLCPKWFARGVPDLLASFRTHLVEKRIPERAAVEMQSARMPELFGVSTKEFRPVAEMRAVVDYLRLASELFRLRESEALRN